MRFVIVSIRRSEVNKGIGCYRQALLQGGKVAAACACAVWTAEVIGLEYAVTAGIIAILSIGGTKKETLTTARNRGLAFLCALGISAVCFHVFGFRIWAFGIYVLCFVTLCLLAGWPEAMAMDSVLISHFLLQESMSIYWLCNEALLFLIGTGFGFLANFFLHPHSREFEQCANFVDEQMVGILSHLSARIGGWESADRGHVHPNHTRKSSRIRSDELQKYDAGCFTRLEDALQKAQICAMKNWNNSLKTPEFYEMDYVAMRQKQRMVLEEIYKSIVMLKTHPLQAEAVGAFMRKVAAVYDRKNPVGDLWEQLEMVFADMKAEPLPENREEFEDRAVLFYILKQLQEFLSLKREFAKKYIL